MLGRLGWWWRRRPRVTVVRCSWASHRALTPEPILPGLRVPERGGQQVRQPLLSVHVNVVLPELPCESVAVTVTGKFSAGAASSSPEMSPVDELMIRVGGKTVLDQW